MLSSINTIPVETTYRVLICRQAKIEKDAVWDSSAYQLYSSANTDILERLRGPMDRTDFGAYCQWVFWVVIKMTTAH